MAPARLARWQREMLAPFAERYAAMVKVDHLSDNELEALSMAAEACDGTNCSWSERGAARLLLPEIGREQFRRSNGAAI